MYEVSGLLKIGVRFQKKSAVLATCCLCSTGRTETDRRAPRFKRYQPQNGRFAAKSNARRLGRLTQMPCPCSHAMLPCSHAPHKEGCPLGSGRRLRLPLGKYT